MEPSSLFGESKRFSANELDHSDRSKNGCNSLRVLLVPGSRTLWILLELDGWKGDGEPIMPATQTIQELQTELQNLESPTSVNAAGGPSSYTANIPAKLVSKVKSAASSTVGGNAPGWVILGVGFAGYLLSETRVIGPLFTIVIMVAIIFQLNSYIKQKGGHFLGI